MSATVQLHASAHGPAADALQAISDLRTAFDNLFVGARTLVHPTVADIAGRSCAPVEIVRKVAEAIGHGRAAP